MTNVVALTFVLDNYELPTEVADKIKAMKTSIEKKSLNRKPSKTQVANDSIKDDILTALGKLGRKAMIPEIKAQMDSLKELSPQKMSSMLSQLKTAGFVDKVVEKSKTYFFLIETPTLEIEDSEPTEE
jgi:hypothetical protein